MSYFCADLADPPQDVRQLRARHDAVLRAVAGAQPADRAERLLAALPQLQPLLGVGGEAHFAGTVLPADLDDAVALRVEARFQAVDFDQQDRLGIERKAEVKRRFDGDQNALVHHLQRGRDDARADDLADRLRRVVDRFEHAEHRAAALRIARQPHPDLGDDAERPFAADDRADQVEPGRIFRRPADLHDLAVGQYHLDAQHVVHRDAVLERVRAAGVRGHVAADRAGPLARRIGCVVIAGPCEVLVEPDVHDARLDDGVAVAEVDLQNLASSA